jgi:hypothetical protein
MPLPLPTEKASSAGTVTTQAVIAGEGSGIGRDHSTKTLREDDNAVSPESSVNDPHLSSI